MRGRVRNSRIYIMETVTNTTPLERRASTKGLLFYVIILIIISFGVQTFQRNDVWRVEISLWYNVIMSSPAKVRPYVAIGTAYGELGMIDEAVKNLEKAVMAEPRGAEYRMNLGVAYGLAGRVEDAIVEIERSLQVFDYYMAHYNLAKILGDNRDIDGAIRHLEAAVRLEANYIPAYNNLGLLYRKQGRTKDAIDIYRRALVRDKEFMVVRYNLARIYMQDELWDEAIIEFEEILKRDPADKAARDELTRAVEAVGGKG